MALTKPQLLGIVRHVLTFVGGTLVAYGSLKSETAVELIGSASTLTGVIWSIINKRPIDEVLTAALTEKPMAVKTPKIVAKPKPTKSEFPITTGTPDKPKPKKMYYKKKERKPIP